MVATATAAVRMERVIVGFVVRRLMRVLMAVFMVMVAQPSFGMT